jgi:prepilin-type N-terminal cleavage/methylation domain-containing protein
MTTTSQERAFTLLELVVVITLIGVASMLIVSRFNLFSFWKEDAALKKILSTIEFLHDHAVADQQYYRLDFSYPQNAYRVSSLITEQGPANQKQIQACGADAGLLTCELAAAKFPSLGDQYSLVAPPDFPSLHTPEPFPDGMVVKNFKTMRGTTSPGSNENDYIMFHPKGFSDFAVIHLFMPTRGIVTIMVNPFTGSAELLDGEKEFEWTYGNKRNK